MTREEAKRIATGLRTDFKCESETMVEFCNTVIKALEQEPILDKIRAEIEAKCCITVGRENDPAITLYDVFEIIDKHKAESEE